MPLIATHLQRFLKEGFLSLGVLLGSLTLIPAKGAITGSAGPTTKFIVVAIICPLTVALLRQIRGGFQSLAFQILLFFIALCITWLMYPEHASMNFMREVPDRWFLWMSLAAFFGGFLPAIKRE